MKYFDFTRLVKGKRIDLGITQKDFAKMLTISQSKYSKIESGKMEPSFIELQLIASLLDIDLTEVLEIKKPKSNNHYFD